MYNRLLYGAKLYNSSGAIEAGAIPITGQAGVTVSGSVKNASRAGALGKARFSATGSVNLDSNVILQIAGKAIVSGIAHRYVGTVLQIDVPAILTAYASKICFSSYAGRAGAYVNVEPFITKWWVATDTRTPTWSDQPTATDGWRLVRQPTTSWRKVR